MDKLFRLTGAVRRDPRVEASFSGGAVGGLRDTWPPEPIDELRQVARAWFERMRDCGGDVRELIHDGRPVACVEDAAFGYVDAYKAHVNVGFFRSAMLDDPKGLLEGTGRRMRHVKIRGPGAVDVDAVRDLIAAAYDDIRRRLAAEP